MNDKIVSKFIRDFRVKNSLCTQCGEILDNPTKVCNRCRKLIKESRNKQIKRIVAEGLCVDCRKPKECDTFHRCNSCREKNYNNLKKLRLEREAAGLCIACASPLDTHGKKCIKCAEKHRFYNSKGKRGV